MITHSLLFVFSAALPVAATAQKQQFRQYVNEKEVGTLTVEESRRGEEQHITIRSHLEVSMLFKLTVDFTLKAIYASDVLQRAEVVVLKNGKPYRQSLTERRNGGYFVRTDEGEHWIDRDKIRYSGAMLYVSVPENIHEIYSETQGQFNPVSSVSSNKFEVANGGKNISEFIYHNGRLEQAMLDHWLAPVTLRR